MNHRIFPSPVFPVAAAFALAAPPVLAQEAAAPIELAPIYIEALRSDIPEGAIPGSIEVIRGEEVVEKTGGDLKGYLARRVAGLSPSNGTISSASETMRGRSVQILLNGVPRTSDLRGFSRELSLIDPDSIERIEVLKGATAVYGNGATGGLINIVTKAAAEEGMSFGGGARFSAQDEDFDDSFATDVNAFWQYRQENFGLRLDGGATFSNDTFDGAGRRMPSDPLVGQGGGDNIDSYNISATADFTAGSNEFLIRGAAVDLKQDLEFNPDYTTDPVSTDFSSPYQGKDVRDETWSVSGDYRNRDLPIGDLRITTFYSHSDRRAAFVPIGPANPLVYYSGDPANPQDPLAQSRLKTEQFGVRGSLANDIGVGTLTIGADYQHDRVSQKILDGRDIIAPMNQDSIAGFAQVDVPITRFFDLRAGARYEKFFLTVKDFTRPEAFQLGVPFPLPAIEVGGGNFDYDEWAFNIGGVAHLTDELDAFAGFSQGFSIPDVGSFTRRAINRNPFDPSPLSFDSIRPQAALVNSYEAGLRFGGERVRANGAVFYSTSKHGTTFDPATNAVSQQKERIWGAELNIEIDATDAWTLGTVLGYQEGKFDSDGDGGIDDYLPNNRIATPFTATVYTDYRVTENFSIGGDAAFTASRHRDAAFDVDDTFTVNLNASYALGDGLVTAGVQNLFDESQLNPTASSVRNIPIASEGRRFWLGYSHTF